MRIALLSCVEPFASDANVPRGTARIAGRTILQHQVAYALSMQCERIVCLCNGLLPEVLDAQHAVETQGARFNAIGNSKALSGLVSSADEVLVVADGLVFDNEVAAERLMEGRRVLTLPAEDAVPLGYERIDRERAWAGIMLINGSMVERLADLPTDIDPASSLLRIAMQAGTRGSQIPTALVLEDGWTIVDGSEKSERFESKWLGKVAKPINFASPIGAIADHCAKLVVRRHRQPQKAARVGQGFSAAFLGIGGLCAWLGYPLVGVGSAFLAWFSSRFAGYLAAIMGGGDRLKPGSLWDRWIAPLLVDGVLLALVGAAVLPFDRVEALFSMFMLVGMLRLFEDGEARATPSWLQNFLSDRGLLAIGLATAIATGMIIPSIQSVGVILMVVALIKTMRAKLTRI